MDLEFILNFIDFTSKILIHTFLIVILARRILKEKSETGKLNIFRAIILSIFLMFELMFSLYFLILFGFFNSVQILQILFIDNISMITVLIGIQSVAALSLVAYANRWESFYYTPIFIFVGMIIFYFLTGYENLYLPYIYISISIGVVFLYMTAFRLKDNGSLGLAILFSLIFATLFLGNSIFYLIVTYCYLLFTLIFGLGYFRIFKEETKQNE